MKKLVILTLSFFLLAVSPRSVFALEGETYKSVIDQREVTLQVFFEEYIEKYDIPIQKQKLLYSKLVSGEILDAEKESERELIGDTYEYLSIDEIKQGMTSKVHIHDDGSVTSIEVDEEDLTENNFLFRAVSSDLYLNQRRFSKTIGTCTASVYLSGVVSASNASRIDEVFGESVSGFGTTGAVESKIQRKHESANKAALAYVRWTVTSTNGLSWPPFSGSIPKGATCYMYIAFIRGNVYVQPQLPNL